MTSNSAQLARTKRPRAVCLFLAYCLGRAQRKEGESALCIPQPQHFVPLFILLLFISFFLLVQWVGVGGKCVCGGGAGADERRSWP
jgi:hypothetical protein